MGVDLAGIPRVSCEEHETAGRRFDAIPNPTKMKRDKTPPRFLLLFWFLFSFKKRKETPHEHYLKKKKFAKILWRALRIPTKKGCHVVTTFFLFHIYDQPKTIVITCVLPSAGRLILPSNGLPSKVKVALSFTRAKPWGFLMFTLRTVSPLVTV